MRQTNSEVILAKSPYNDIFARLHKVKQRIRDKYRGKEYFPIGTRRPIQEYDPDKDIPEDELYFFKMDTVASDNATSMCMIGQSGTQKTTLIKNIVYYNSLLQKTKVGVLSLKENSLDWEKCNRMHDNPGMLYPDDPATMQFVAGCPHFALRQVDPAIKRKLKVMNLHPENFADAAVLKGLGFAGRAADYVRRRLLSGANFEQILAACEGERDLFAPTVKNIQATIQSMIVDGFLSEGNAFDINKIWDEEKSWAFGFNDKETRYLSVYVDKIMTQIFDRATGKGRKERYVVFIDDCYKAFGLSAEEYPSVQTGISALTLWRSTGINIILAIQSPSMINDIMYGDIKHFFIYRTPEVGRLAKFIPNKRILDEIRTLDFRPAQYISQCIHVFPDRQTYARFYPFNACIAN